MQPANREAEILDSELSEIFNSVEPDFVQWTPGMLLVIDNHLVLHGRGEARCSGDRKLLRAIYTEVKP
jgi:alpha-ketoglutarate-dependent taurine dioxygenase